MGVRLARTISYQPLATARSVKSGLLHGGPFSSDHKLPTSGRGPMLFCVKYDTVVERWPAVACAVLSVS
jgi:hypothetical protein